LHLVGCLYYYKLMLLLHLVGCLYYYKLMLLLHLVGCLYYYKLIGFYNENEKCLQRGTDGSLNKAVCASSCILPSDCIYYAFLTN